MSRSTSMKRRWKDKKYRKHMLRKRKQQWKDPETKREHDEAVRNAAPKISASLRTWWEANYERLCRVRKKQVTTKELKRLTNLARANWDDPKMRRKLVKHLREISQSKEGRKNNSKRTKKLWANPKYRVKQIKAIHNKKWRKAVSESNTQTKTGKPSWNAGYTKDTHPGLMKLSQTNKGKIPDYKRYKAWYPNEHDKQIEMRSSWEVAFALWLDAGGIEWEYETQYFHVGRGIWKGETYTPDFYLPDQDVFVELKGHLTKENAAKMKRFHKLYPDVKLWMFRNMGKVLEFRPRKAA